MRGISTILAIAACLAAVLSSTDGICIQFSTLPSILERNLLNIKGKVCEAVQDKLSKMVEEYPFSSERVKIDNIAIDGIQLQRLVAQASQCDVKVGGNSIIIELNGVKLDMTGQWKKIPKKPRKKPRKTREFEVDATGAGIRIELETRTATCTNDRMIAFEIVGFDCGLDLEPSHLTMTNAPRPKDFDDHLIRTAKTHVKETCDTEKALDELRSAVDGFFNGFP